MAFDFAYLYKPVIYSQFDRATYYDSHFYDKGYFDFERDGFGPVCYDYESTVKTIVNAISNDCVETEDYAERVKEAFSFTDKNNCERMANELLNLMRN